MQMDGTKVKNNLFSKGQRVVNDNYREGYDSHEWNGGTLPKREESIGVGRTRITFGNK
jgi:hypothetical protein